jgi:hypothetical protein
VVEADQTITIIKIVLVDQVVEVLEDIEVLEEALAQQTQVVVVEVHQKVTVVLVVVE